LWKFPKDPPLNDRGVVEEIRMSLKGGLLAADSLGEGKEKTNEPSLNWGKKKGSEE